MTSLQQQGDTLINILKFRTLSLSVGYQGWNTQNAGRIVNREDPDQTASTACLIWVCAICLGLFRRQLVFEILEHLP